MPEISKFLGTPSWQGLGAIFTLAGIFVAFYLTTRDIIWLFLILWVVLFIAAMLLCIMLRERVKNNQPSRLYFYSVCISIGLICFLLGLSLIAFGDLRNTLISSATSTPTVIPTVTQSTSTPTSTATQGDLLETWAYRTRMWESPALIYPDVEISVESEPDTHPSYVFAYQFQSTTNARYAGFKFELYRTPDLSAYNSVQIKFRYSDDRTNCDFGLADNEGHYAKKSLGKVGTDYWTTSTFPLDIIFSGVNRRALTEVYVSTDKFGDGLVHKCIINEIRFFKP
ncbi:MAG TPA: hypothetical protein VJ183_05455 [Chloroflexia bacterium]|nr:hypothetical protein [Chloroflexia bacterium]